MGMIGPEGRKYSYYIMGVVMDKSNIVSITGEDK